MSVIIEFQQGRKPTAEYTGCKDTYIRGGDSADINYEDAGKIYMKQTGASYERSGLIKFDITDIPDEAIILSAKLHFTLYGIPTGVCLQYLYKCLRNFIAASATANKYDGVNPWTLAGCKSDGNDMAGTFGTATGALASFPQTGEEGYNDPVLFDTSPAFVAMIQAALSGNLAIFVIHQRLADDKDVTYNESLDASPTYRPRLEVEYTLAPPYPVPWLKKKVISGYHCFMNAYLHAKRKGYDPLKLPDGTTF